MLKLITMKVLVTGGAGFIGSHICKLLADLGHTVTVIDNLSTGHEELVDKRASFFKIDLASEDKLEEALKGQDAVIHLASYALVSESVTNPTKYSDNITGAIKLLEAMKKVGVKKIIFSSSCTVYGNPTKLPLTEDAPLGSPENPYGITKVAVEQFCALYHKLHGFDVVILRYFNPYGPGELHTPETHAIPNFIKAALAKKPIPLYWKGEQIRDFIYVDDLANAHVVALSLSGLHIYNIGTETGVKVKDVLKKIFEILGYEVPIEDKGERKGDVSELVASAEKIKKELGWQTRVDLKEGLKRSIEFYRRRLSST